MRPFRKRVLLATMVAAVTVLVQGCASTNSSNESGVEFPDIDRSYIEEGTFIAPDAVLRVSRGQSKAQVRHLLDNPHFGEGMFGVREWNYIFNFHTDRVPEGYITCQYQVGFDEDVLVERTHWKNPVCADLLVPVEVEPVSDKPGEMKVVLSTDVLFDFDSDVLRFEGRRSLERFAKMLHSDFAGSQLHLLGYTDRIGDDAYNLALSKRRAQAVRQALIEDGVSATNTQAMGLGEQQPVVRCADVRGAALKECLQPNRRVELLIREKSDLDS